MSWFQGPPPRVAAPRGEASQRLLDEPRILGMCIPIDTPGAEDDLESAELQMLRDPAGGWTGRLQLKLRRSLDWRRIEAASLDELVALASMHGSRPRTLEMRVFEGPNFSRQLKTKKHVELARRACAEWFAASVEEEQRARRASYADRRDAAFVAREAELCAALEAAPDDEALWSVFGDFLHEHGDPRGEIIATNPDPARVQALLPAIIGELAECECWFELRRGHPHHVTVGTKGAARTLELLAHHASTRFLARVTVQSTAQAAIEPLLSLLRARRIRELHVHGSSAFPLDRLAGLTGLEVLSLRQTTELASLGGLAGLRELAIYGGGRAPHAAAPIELRSLAGLAGLRKLTVFASDLRDLDALASLVGLRELTLCVNRAGLAAAPLLALGLGRLVTYRDCFPPAALEQLTNAGIAITFRNRDA